MVHYLQNRNSLARIGAGKAMPTLQNLTQILKIKIVFKNQKCYDNLQLFLIGNDDEKTKHRLIDRLVDAIRVVRL